MAITCCNGCVPPKRTPECHGRCQEYIREKMVHDAQREQKNDTVHLQVLASQQRSDGVLRAKRRWHRR